MNVLDTLVWGGIATVTMTAFLEAAMYLGWTRMSLPFILGTLLTSDRRTAPFLGTALHLVNGYVFAFGYAVAFEAIGRSGWWVGALLGLVHSTAILILMPFIAGVHPRMATEQDGPDARRALQPPGFFALNYGRRTPLFGIISHLIFGTILGAFYHVA